MAKPNPKAILVINQDNIGDLVCTTPLIRRLRNAYPQARIDALVTSYNVAVLAANPALDHVYAITKTKHVKGIGAKLAAAFGKVAMLLKLRRNHYDMAFLATHSNNLRAIRICRMAGIRQLVGMSKTLRTGYREHDLTLSEDFAGKLNQSALFAKLAELIGIEGEVPAGEIRPEAETLAATQAALRDFVKPGKPLIGLHISARKPSQRWPAAGYIELAKQLHREFDAQFMLFWSPGAEDNPLHPGDDNKAQTIMAACAELPLFAYPTHELPRLIAGLSHVDSLICSDGGAMHIAAGLGKPIVCLFGQSGLSQWHPWGVPYIALQPPSLQVSDVSVEQVTAAYRQLQTHHGHMGMAGNASLATPANANKV